MDGNVNRIGDDVRRGGAAYEAQRGGTIVFVVSADAVMRATIGRALSEAGHRVVMADRVEQLDSHLHGGRQVVVLDAAPGEAETASALLARHPGCRLVYLTIDPYATLRSEQVRYVIRPISAANLNAGTLANLVARLLRS
jgi:DNA-binding NtrC family response regulator